MLIPDPTIADIKEAQRLAAEQATRELLERCIALLDRIDATLNESRVRVEALRK